MRIVPKHRLLMLLLLPVFSPANAQDAAIDSVEDETRAHVVMHKNPGCGCCEIWADHLRAHGLTVASVPDDDILRFKADHDIPRPLMSCHTAVVAGYFVEGHVPADDILRLLREKPAHVKGIAVPGMPLGSPGMEHPRPQDFNTIALLSDGSAYVFAEHAAGEDYAMAPAGERQE
jgi:hypothetical protein